MDDPKLPFPTVGDPSSSQSQLSGIEEMQNSAHETESSKLTSSDKLSALPTLPADPKNAQRWGFQRNYRHSLDAAVSFPSYALDELESIRNLSSWGPSGSRDRHEGGSRAVPTSFRAPGSGDSSPGPSRETPKQRISFESERGSHGTPKRIGQAFAKLASGRPSDPSASPNLHPPRSPSPNAHPRNHHRPGSPLRMLHQWSSGMGRSHRHARDEPFVPVNPFKMRRRKKKFTLSGILSPPPSPDVEGGGSAGSSSTGAYDCEDIIPITDIKAVWEDVRLFVTDTLPRQLYLNMLLRLPAMYFGRVARIFEDAEVSRPEIQKMIDVMCRNLGGSDEERRQQEQQQIRPEPSRAERTNTIDQSGPASPSPVPPTADTPLPFPDEWTPTSVSPSLFRFKHSWEVFIDSLIREWKTLNIVSALLSSAILSIFQVPEAAEDPLTRTLALLSLVSALMSLSYGCMYIIRFQTMRSMFRASRWAEQAQKTKTLIWWNVWVMLAMPAVWMSWAMLFFLSSIMSFVWRSGSEDDPEVRPPLSRKVALGPRIAITMVLAIGVVYLLMIIRTLKRYGSGPSGGSLHGLLHVGHAGRGDRPAMTPGEGSSAAGHGFALARIRTPESDASEQRGRKRQRLDVHQHLQSQSSKSLRRKGSVEKVETENEEKEIAVVSVNLQDKSADSL